MVLSSRPVNNDKCFLWDKTSRPQIQNRCFVRTPSMSC
uniref:Uncharacterized protein n=1 Tax=Rhizophora mucronata TaxID=61149 RepID=A0A2P2Q4E3_RHIMU